MTCTVLEARRKTSLMADQDSYLEDEWDEEVSPKSLKRLPNPVTTTKKGPLSLHVHSDNHEQAPPQTKQNIKGHTMFFYPTTSNPRRGQLTRFPIPNIQRPMDRIEQELGDIMCSEIGENIHLISEWPNSHKDTKPHLPTLHPMLKYTPLGGQQLQDDRRDDLEYTTHTTNHGPMNISITYSRHTTPRTESIMSRSRNQYWNGHSTYPPAANAFNNRLHVSKRNQRRHQQGRVQKDEKDTHLSPRTQGRTSHRSYHQRLNTTSQIRPSIAPHNLEAETLHRLRPITSRTTLVGRGLGNFHNRQNTIGYHY